ncbi:hypothetical protein [Metaclostridioides mangenotii]|uniref:hypothetical protein n=1 Tax=Metaclostridioides mangenotii TaxID=1540 RepID=UPI0004675DE6|nr:hypothetical protein [Clostridioides mangenotii]
MGYCIEMKKSTIRIKEENYKVITDSLKHWVKAKSDTMWIYPDDILDADNIEEVMDAIRYPVYTNEGVSYIDFFGGEKLGNDLEIFSVIAPYIEDGI